MRIFILYIALVCTWTASAQVWDTTKYQSHFKQWVPQEQLDGFNLKQIEINKQGMYALSGWGVGNLLYGSIASGLTHGEVQVFHASNMIWGSINTLIGVPGLIASYNKKKVMGRSFGETILHQHGQEKLYLINGCLDFAYIGAGAAAWGFSDRLASQRTRNILSGVGKSFVMQGGFLLFFDWGMYIAHSQHAYRNLNRYVAGLAFTGEGVSYELMF